MNLAQPKVLIVILNYGTFDLTLKIITELHEKLDYNNYSIMVIDNCSPNESANILKEKSYEMDYIFVANEKNTGYAAGNNIGIRYAIRNEFKYTWILNNDVELRENCILQELVHVLEEHDDIGCTGPKIYNADGTICAPYCRRPSVWNMTIGVFEDKKYRISKQDVSGKVYRVYGCCMLLRNKAMSEIDCMDERTFLYGEEAILSERMMQKSYGTYYDPTVSVKHLGSVSMKKASPDSKKRQLLEQEKSRKLYLREYRKFSLFEVWFCNTMRRLIGLLR